MPEVSSPTERERRLEERVRELELQVASEQVGFPGGHGGVVPLGASCGATESGQDPQNPSVAGLLVNHPVQ